MNNAHQPNTPPKTMLMKNPPHTINAPQQTMNSQKDAARETILVLLIDFQK